MKIGLLTEGLAGSEPDVISAVRKAADLFKSLGARVDEVSLDSDRVKLWRSYFFIFFFIVGSKVLSFAIVTASYIGAKRTVYVPARALLPKIQF